MFDVMVVGAGVIGLTCAIRLVEGGARVVLVCAAAPEDTVSATAAAVWYPTGTTDADPRVLDWAVEGFDELSAQAGDDGAGVVMRSTRMLLREPTPTPWWAVALKDLRTLGPGAATPGYAQEWRFTVPTVEMRPYLRHLLDRFTGAGGVVRRRTLERLDAVRDAAVVVNATGLAAGRLVGDPAVHPIRGRIVLVTNPGLQTSVRDEDHPDGPTYIHPRSRDVVLGGTFEPMATDVGPAPRAARAILARCTDLVPELAGARVIGEAAGLRPGRAGGIRLESVAAAPGGGPRVVHCYGHGGAGVTLAWGCAAEVARLVRQG
jgi:D-amino-acid oxidase